MAMRIACWRERKRGRGLFVPKYKNLSIVLLRDALYGGDRVREELIEFFVSKYDLNLDRMKKSIMSLREGYLLDSSFDDYNYNSDSLRPYEESELLVVSFIGAGLKCYHENSINIFNHTHYDARLWQLDIEIEDFQSFLGSNNLPLPSELFPDGIANTSIFKNRLHNRKGTKEYMSLDEIKQTVFKIETIQKQKIDKNLIPIKTGKNIKWKNLKITFLSETEILIQFGEESATRFCHQAGFADKRNRKPILAWHTFRSFAAIKEIETTDDNRIILRKRIQEIRHKLKALFPDIDGDPIYRGKDRIIRFIPQLTMNEGQLTDFRRKNPNLF